MRLWFCFPIVLVLLGGCAALPHWADLPVFANAAGTSGPEQPSRPGQPARFSFDWALSGDPEVGPLQVFDDGVSVWLQFREHDPVPAIFERTEHGDRPVPWRRESAYVVLEGVFAHLVFRGGHLVAQAHRAQHIEPAGVSGQARAVERADTTPLQPLAVPESLVPAGQGVEMPGVNAASPQAVSVSLPGPVALTMPAPVAVSSVLPVPGLPVVPVVPVQPVFAAGPDDGTLRGALARWSRLAGWTFEPEHWAVDVDVPLGASADFPSPFIEAVQALVAATELSERPLQPCFYSNRVLRVVPYAQACDRSTRGLSGGQS